MPDDDTIMLALSPGAADLLMAAGGFDPGEGLRPALVGIISGLTMIATAIAEVVPPDEYALYRALLVKNLHRALHIIESPDPSAAFSELLDTLREEHLQRHRYDARVN